MQCLCLARITLSPWRVLDALEYPHWHGDALPLAAANPLQALLAARRADVAVAGLGGRRRSPGARFNTVPKTGPKIVPKSVPNSLTVQTPIF